MTATISLLLCCRPMTDRGQHAQSKSNRSQFRSPARQSENDRVPPRLGASFVNPEAALVRIRTRRRPRAVLHLIDLKHYAVMAHFELLTHTCGSMSQRC